MHNPLDDTERQVRLAVYQHFAATGEAPSASTLAQQLGRSTAEVEAAFERLEALHALALAPASKTIWMAHPFSAIPTAFPVQTAERRFWANCAWDALGLATVLGKNTETRTACADCGAPLTLTVRHNVLERVNAVVHFSVPPRRFWENVGYT
jgi:DNA-binding transcriptional MocR family regulator